MRGKVAGEMDLFFLKIFAFLRPILLIELDFQLLGFGFFELAGIMLIALVGVPMLKHMMLQGRVAVSSVDILVLLCLLWATATVVVYPEYSSIKDYIKWIIPFLTYLVAKNVLNGAESYLSIIRLLLTGISIPLVISAILILQGKGLESTSYWTGVGLYEGVYSGSHILGHSMTLFIMLAAVYYYVRKHTIREINSWEKFVFGIFLALMVAALYNLVNSQLRTGMLGTALFITAAIVFYQKKLILPLVIVGILGVAASIPKLEVIFHDIVAVQRGERDIGWAASGRPMIWAHNIEEFRKLGIERKVIGAGIGNTIDVYTWSDGKGDSFWDSHNDYLAVLIHTGFVGIILYIALQLAILSKILAIRGPERWIIFSFFVVVNIMNVMSNSYITRFGFAQIYYLVVAYAEMRRKSLFQNEAERLHTMNQEKPLPDRAKAYLEER